MAKTLATAVVALLLAGSAGAAQPADGFWDRQAEGYWWYQDPAPPDLPLEPEPEPKIPPPPPPPAKEEAPPVVEAAPEAPQMFSALWLKDQVEAARIKAVDDPTPENVRLYYYLQRMAMDKATRFAAVAKEVVTGDPFLDENARRPTATFAANAMSARAKEQEHTVLRGLSDRVGLVFFYQSTCAYCDQQAKILKIFQEKHGISITAVSSDNRPLPNGLFPEYRYDPALLDRLDIKIFPTLFLAHPHSNRMGAISYGVVSLEDLRRRTLIAAVKEGWVDQAAFAATKPVNSIPLSDSIPPPPPDERAALEGDPEAIVDYIRSRLRQ